MAQTRKNKKLLAPAQDTLSLDGLESFLENATLETVKQDETIDFSPSVTAETPLSETRLILDLLAQLENVNDLVLETGYQLAQTRERVRELEGLLMGEELLVARIKDLEVESQKVLELETWLDALRAENEHLKRPWWKKLLGLN